MSDPLKPEGAGSPEHYTDRTADPLADALDEISQCLKNATPLPASATAAAMQSQHDQLLALRDVYAPAMLAAVGAVFKRHAPQGVPTRCYDLDLRCHAHAANAFGTRGFAGIRDCPDCTYRERLFCTGCDHEESPCPTYLAVSRALLGEGTGDE